MGGFCIPCLVPLSPHPGPGHLPMTCWNLWLSLGHHRGDSSCTWRVDACGAVGAGRLVVPQDPVPCGGSRLGHAYGRA